MTDITYTYEIIAVDEAARSMEVVYTSETHGVMHVGARLPFEGEPLEQVIVMFAPVQEWRLRDMAVVAPKVGAAGQMTDAEPAPPPLEDQIRAARAAAYREEADPIFFQYQRGEATEQDWLDKIEEIRARYPYPEGTGSLAEETTPMWTAEDEAAFNEQINAEKGGD